MFVSSLTNSDFSSFWLYPNFCHKKHLVFFFLNKLRLFDKNSALFIFQCTMCAFGADCVLKTTMPTYYVDHWHCPFFNVQCVYFLHNFYLFYEVFTVSLTAYLLYHTFMCLSSTFLKLFKFFRFSLTFLPLLSELDYYITFAWVCQDFFKVF